MIVSVEIITALLWDITMLNIMLKARWISTSFWDFCLETRFCRLFFFWEVNSFPPCQLLIVRTATKETLTGNPFILTPFFNLMTKSQERFLDKAYIHKILQNRCFQLFWLFHFMIISSIQYLHGKRTSWLKALFVVAVVWLRRQSSESIRRVAQRENWADLQQREI